MANGLLVITLTNIEKYNPALAELAPEERVTKRLKWLRWQVDTHRDPDLLDLPRGERWIWPVLMGLSGKGGGSIRMSYAQLAREADLPVKGVEHAIQHLIERGRVAVE